MIRKLTSISLMVCLVCLSSASRASAAELHPSDDSSSPRQKLELVGVGANVTVKLSDGHQIRGLISSIDDAGFTLVPKSGMTARQVSYNETSEVKLVSTRYHTSATPDAAEVRQAVAGLGVGKHVMVRTKALKIHGRIQAVESDHFVILPDDVGTPVMIAYQDVQQVGKNLGILSTIGLVVVVIAVIVVVAKVK